jgi:hypothetical protein
MRPIRPIASAALSDRYAPQAVISRSDRRLTKLPVTLLKGKSGEVGQVHPFTSSSLGSSNTRAG